jgi:kynurenine formamidase
MESGLFDKMAERLRNWGRWGPDDVRGTLNHIGPETLMRAAAEVRSGKSFSLGLPFSKDGPQDGSFRDNPKLSMVQIAMELGTTGRATMSDDRIEMPLQCATQWDALSHAHYDGQIYNGCEVCDVLSEQGASRHGVEHLANPGIVSRGVLVDVPRHLGVDRLPMNYRIGIDDLRAVLAAQNAEVLPGDIVLVRTGHIRHFTVDNNRQTFLGGGPGLDGSCAEWLHETSAAAVAADNLAVEYVEMADFNEGMPLPLHMFCLRDMGMPLGEMFDLEQLSTDCASDGRYTFMLAAQPLAFVGAVGSPVNPIVLK